jgi:hypothetical protein
MQVFITDPNCLTRNDDGGSLLKSALTFRREDVNPEAEILKPVYNNRCDRE